MPDPRIPITITNVRVFDGQQMSSPSSVMIDDGRIATVGVEPVYDVGIIDGAGGTLLPGLIDAHVHISRRADIDALLAHGVTTALDMGHRSLRKLADLTAEVDTVEVVSAGAPASAAGGIHTSVMGFPVESGLVDSAEAEGFVERRVSEGAGFIKLIVEEHRPGGPPVLAPETIAAVVAAARVRGLLSIAHATTAGAMRRAVEAGVDVLTHVPVDEVVDDQLVEHLAASGTVVVPTLTMMRAVSQLAPDSPAYRPGTDLAHAVASVAALGRANVPVLAGTDANSDPSAIANVPPGSSLPDELELLVRAGMSPLDALRSATAGTAERFGLGDRGRIEPGRRADLLLVTGDPATDIDALRGVQAVWVGGVEAEGV